MAYGNVQRRDAQEQICDTVPGPPTPHGLPDRDTTPPDGRRGGDLSAPAPRGPVRLGRYSCAGSGSIVRGSTGTCTSSRAGVVIMNTRITGKASMNDR